MNVSFDDGYYFNVNHEFDREYWHYEDNRRLYECIRPCHVAEHWIVSVRVVGKEQRRTCKRLSEAVNIRDSMRAMRDVK